MISRNDPCWCGSGNKWKKCHFPQTGSSGGENGAKHSHSIRDAYYKKYRILIKTPEQIAGIRRACRLTAEILDKTARMAQAGVTTNALNDYAYQLHMDAGALPAPLGYGSPPYPKSICTSLNEVICHGIANDIPLKEGDFLNIDVSCELDGYFGDCSRMVAIGKVDPEKQRTMEASYECLMRSIAILKPGVLVCEIADVIESCAAEYQCSVVNQFVGHGTGVHFHEAPEIPHHHNNSQIPLAAGMTFTIEPMVNAGVRGGYIDPKDQWTARTLDGKPSAQWEHTILITENGHEILTLPPV